MMQLGSNKLTNYYNPWRSLLACAFILAALSATAGDYGYDPAADPALTYQQATAQAAATDKLVLLVFGSEWCKDCRSLNKKMGQPPLRDTVADNFVVAHIDIGNWDKNMAFTTQFGKPVANGIPSIVIVTPAKEVLYVSRGGELATARSAELASLDAWFRDRLAQVRAQ